MTKPLFDDDDVLNDDGKAFQRRVKDVLTPILADAAERGFRLRDVLYIFQGSLTLEAAFLITQRRIRRLGGDVKQYEVCRCAAGDDPGPPGGDGA